MNMDICTDMKMRRDAGTVGVKDELRMTPHINSLQSCDDVNDHHVNSFHYNFHILLPVVHCFEDYSIFITFSIEY